MAGGRYPYPKHVWYVRHTITGYDLIPLKQTDSTHPSKFRDLSKMRIRKRQFFSERERPTERKNLKDTWAVLMIYGTTSFNKPNPVTCLLSITRITTPANNEETG